MIPKTIETYYRFHAPFYNSTRWAFLFGRNALEGFFPPLPEKPTILDLGCGTGKHFYDLLNKYPGAKIYALDQSREMLEQADKNLLDRIQFKNEGYSASSFDEGKFDLILCSYSMSMMAEIEDKMRSIKLHLKPGAYVLVVDFDTTPFTWFEKWMKKNHVHFDHLLFRKLKESFKTERSISKSAYFGLYRYSSFVGRNE